MSTPYSTQYYERLKEDSNASARVLVPIIGELFRPRTVVDVGCGSGTWTKAYEAWGAQILGIDGSEVQPGQLLIAESQFRRIDLSKPFQLDRRFDLVNCLEVAEHLDGSRADGFVSDLAQLGDVIVFSAAVPGQGGTHHVNEQWPSYWIPKFEALGFQALDCLRYRVWNEPKVAWWYVQNAFVFVRRDKASAYPKAVSTAQSWPADVVHPRAYMRATVPSEMSPRMIKEVIRALPHFPSKVLQHFGR